MWERRCQVCGFCILQKLSTIAEIDRGVPLAMLAAEAA
jgi:uncharacterized cysteine cluster protein YcgN (CxxCxxCC family)